MKFLRLILLSLFICFGFHALALGPSSENCSYYSDLESELSCGPQSYLEKWARPMCEKYLKVQPQLSQDLQAWFPKVRYCLQQEIDQYADQLTCRDLDKMAIASHVKCYVETGFCELTEFDKTALMQITSKALLHPLWIETSLRIYFECLN